jgi:hypothetical protein
MQQHRMQQMQQCQMQHQVVALRAAVQSAAKVNGGNRRGFIENYKLLRMVVSTISSFLDLYCAVSLRMRLICGLVSFYFVRTNIWLGNYKVG